jgi:hypothetical protein
LWIAAGERKPVLDMGRPFRGVGGKVADFAALFGVELELEELLEEIYFRFLSFGCFPGART